MLVRRLRLNSGLAFDFAEGARASPRTSTSSQHKRHSFRPRHSAGTPDDQVNRFTPSAMPDLRASVGLQPHSGRRVIGCGVARRIEVGRETGARRD